MYTPQAVSVGGSARLCASLFAILRASLFASLRASLCASVRAILCGILLLLVLNLSSVEWYDMAPVVLSSVFIIA
ncbi:hypothetical protein E2C01_071845 [Portunus trituberculatus]|uniref:Uncharacterized protein n=1 Tax=Portunus trituberculatus TaxID=210409 RepID=A0A5B7I4Z2_PORTR|nr:hypothetical protein [Portunus trituberculatus]